MDRSASTLLPSSLLLAALAAAPGVASGLSLSNLALQNDSTADFSQTTNGFLEQGSTTLAVVSQSGTTFTTRLAAQSAADKDTGSGGFAEAIVDVDYTLTFDVDAGASEFWRLLVDTSRLGALTSIDDSLNEGNDFALASAGAVAGTVGGDTLDSGTLGLDAVNLAASTVNSNVEIDQSSLAELSGTGPASLSLGFTFELLTQSFDTSITGGAPANEGAARLGLAASLAGFPAGDYPGVGGRTASADGHFVGVQLVPEPGTGLLLALGMLGLAGRRRR